METGLHWEEIRRGAPDLFDLACLRVGLRAVVAYQMRPRGKTIDDD